jgi:hypothetical protein
MTDTAHVPTTSLMPVDAFMATVGPAYGDTWQDAIAALLGSPADADVIATLRPAARDRQLRNPVWVAPDEEIGELRVANGMHRVTACHLEGAPVPYRVSTGWSDLPAGLAEVEVAFTVADNEARDEDAFFELVFDWLRSFPVGDDWVETSGMGSSREMFTAWYVLPERLVAALPSLLADRLAPHGMTVAVTSITPADRDDAQGA